jgi:predicted XRE-type DNA-binding protein
VPKLAPISLPKEPFAKEIDRILRERQLTQTAAARIVRDQASQISLITNRHLDGFSVERLVKYLTRLGCDVDIKIARAKRSTGKVRIRAR